jgi:hypothetical protein
MARRRLPGGNGKGARLEAYYLHRTRVERIAERKIRRRQLTDDGNVEITGRDLRQREHRALGEQIAFEWAAR